MHENHALDHLMVVEASRYINDGDIVMVGTGLPMVASLFAQKNHAPHMCYVVETGTMAPEVIPTPISVCDPRVMYRAVSLGSLLDTLGGVLQRGLADVAFLGGAQIDQFANVNSTVIGDYDSPKVRLPGSGGANDLASPRPQDPRHHSTREAAIRGTVRLHHQSGLHRRTQRQKESRPPSAISRHLRDHRPHRHVHRQGGGTPARR